MTAPSPETPRPDPPLTRAEAETLATELVGEMIEHWRQGERVLPEDFLARHPGLWEHPAAASDLIYEELCLRQEYGPEVPLEQVLRRFPRWRPQLEVLFDCQRILSARRDAPRFPTAGESLGDFLLLAELGRGAQGRVFLASQLSLGDRPVVLKLSPSEAREHLSLARLQHTHIVPLYSAQDHPARGLRALCMPYFGGDTLARLLEALRPRPPSRRTGLDLLDALDRVQSAAPLVATARGPAWQALAGASYVQAICWIGICLADALQYAHERGLVHLDLKPSNVLLAADGQPMLLDFHLARGPIHPGGGPQWFGGTAGFMSPEQQAALLAIQSGRKITQPVDGRSDIYSLGVVLYEALGGDRPAPGEKPRPLHRDNPEVSIGLADAIARCLADDPGDRYPRMADFAADLRRHLAHLPLAGVRNRSPAERWRKWRRRRPLGVALAGMMLAVLTAAVAVSIAAVSHFAQRIDQARTALDDGRAQMAAGHWEGAISTLRLGLTAARGIPFRRDLADELDHSLRLAAREHAAVDRAKAARELHQLTDRVRFLYGADLVPPEGLKGVAACCRVFWENRDRIVERLSPCHGGSPALEPVVRDDLLDLAIFWADLRVRLALTAGKAEARREALTILDQAESLFGPSAVLDEERKIHGRRAAGRGSQATGKRPRPEPAEHTAWEHSAMGRALLRSGALERAARELEHAVRLQPQGLWPNFYHGLCAYRLGRNEDAALAYSVCIGAAPEAAGCYYNRALALDALGRDELALRDYDQAMRLDPTLAVAALNRGMLHHRAGRHAKARVDLVRARELGADPAVVSFDLALVDLARGDQAAALNDLRQALQYDPHRPDARDLYDCLVGRASASSLSSRPKGNSDLAPAPGPESR